MLQSGFKYFTQNKLYIWKRRVDKTITQKKVMGKEKDMTEIVNEVKLGGNKLKDLAWSLDVLDLNKHVDTN